MCKWGTDREILIGNKAVYVDECIADLVVALNDGGIETTGSCCGHGKSDGNILFADGRWLEIHKDRSDLK